MAVRFTCSNHRDLIKHEGFCGTFDMAEAQEPLLNHLLTCCCQDLTAVGTKDACLSVFRNLFEPVHKAPYTEARPSSR